MSTSVFREQSKPTAVNASAAEAMHEQWTGRRRSVGQRILAAAAGITLAGSLAACGENAAAAPENTSSTPVATSSETPGRSTPNPEETTTETVAPTQAPETEVTVESLRIPADLPSNELAEASINLIVEWTSAGATEGTIEKTYDAYTEFVQDGKGGADEFNTYYAALNAETYGVALFGDAWQDNPAAVEMYDNITRMNSEIIGANLSRAVTGEPLIVRYETIRNVSETLDADDKRVVDFESTEYLDGEPHDFTASYEFDTSSGFAILVEARYS